MKLKRKKALEWQSSEIVIKLGLTTIKSDGGSSGPSSTSGGRVSSSEPTYMMEHLATFTVTKETGIVYPADGMRRLLQLEKSNGIWSQKMQLRLERNWVLIMDNETGVKTHQRNLTLIFFNYKKNKRKKKNHVVAS